MKRKTSKSQKPDRENDRKASVTFSFNTRSRRTYTFRTEPSPDKVAGYLMAQRAGELPPRPTVAPAPLPGTPARVLVNRLTLWGTIGFFGLLLLFTAVKGLFTNALPFLIIIAIYAAVVFWAGKKAQQRFRAEMAQGYTTVVINDPNFRNLRQGGITIGGGRNNSNYRPPTPWSFRGVWVLDNMGVTVSGADPNFLPPGYYPSPGKDDQYEFWTGVCWTGKYRKTQP